MELPDTLMVRGKPFRLSKTSTSPSYSGQVTDQVTAIVVQVTSMHLWTASLVEMRPEPVWKPAVASADTAQAALELAFVHANVPADVPSQQTVGEARVEQEDDALPSARDGEPVASGSIATGIARLQRMIERAGERKVPK